MPQHHIIMPQPGRAPRGTAAPRYNHWPTTPRWGAGHAAAVPQPRCGPAGSELVLGRILIIIVLGRGAGRADVHAQPARRVPRVPGA